MSAATTHYTPRQPESAMPRLVPAQDVISTRPAVPVGVLFLGIVAFVVAAWGAAAPFDGPEFGFVADRAVAWQWSVTSACLGLGPGVVALVAALGVVAMATRTSYARRADLWALGLVVTLCGAWFVVGQYVWPVVYGSRFIAPAGTTHFMWEELAFAIGPGVILVFCGAVFMGWAVRRQLALVAAQVPPIAVPVPAADPETATLWPVGADPASERATMAPPVAADPSPTETFEPPAGGSADPSPTETFEPPGAGARIDEGS